ncbi:MAG: tripartite tricarboxylate transporter TctB family protein [Deltaproteobacteria bacterium]|nr:tripartite tricarboxylate transporter TctB family protein [Deltaproteobacteria bacterium]
MSNQETFQRETDDFGKGRGDSSAHRKGEALFAAIMVVMTAVLLAQIRTQTKWIENISFFQQPCFWPLICLGGLLLFAIGFLIQSLLKTVRREQVHFCDQILPLDEVWNWVRTLEYSAYFLIYVFMVPKLGYLPTTLVFCPLLTVREGYRERKILVGSVLAAFLITLVFKAILKVKLPAGELYNLFPDAIRNFLMIYF